MVSVHGRTGSDTDSKNMSYFFLPRTRRSSSRIWNSREG